jgi:hypothetical protein
MKTAKLFLSLALVFFTCASLHAQVTIGGTDVPKAGAILDLNSTSKGGLLLSNVSIGDFFKIPSIFHGGGGVDSTLKAGLTGAMIYNTNPAFCTGVHVWNGQHWGRIATTTTVPAPGALSIASGSANLMGGDEIEFAADPNAKTYKWFAGKNGAAYEYLGITTTPSYTETFPAGNCRMKVIMDDCRSLKERETSFVMGSASPNFGSLDGGNYIYIYGDFPYAATGDYAAQENLVAHYDGINNQGLGDKQHNNEATSWKDLKNSFYLPRTATGDGQWLSNGFQALDDTISFESSTFPNTYPLNNSARTVEVIFRTPEQDNMFGQILNTERQIFLYGAQGRSRMFGIEYRGQKSDYVQASCSTPENQWIFYAIGGNEVNLVTCLSSTPSLESPDNINTVTSTYQNSITDSGTKSYINNTPAYILARMITGGTTLNTGQEFFRIGKDLAYSTFLSIRLYNRVLNETEIKYNAGLDQIRYLAPPTVTIDGKPCTEVVVLSPHFLMCKVPAGTGAEAKDIVINNTITYTGAYKYVDPVSDFYVSEISPIIGSAGTALTLNGNRLNEINEVLVGNDPCTFVSKEAGEYKCTLPANPSLAAGEVDITITVGSGENAEVFRFAKVFEYLP